MATVGLKKGTENITANVPDAVAADIDRLAQESDLSRNKYVGLLLRDAAEKRRVFKVEVRTLVTETSPPYRTKTGK